MPFTQADIDELDAAIASGEKSVTTSEGRSLTWRNLDELARIRDMMNRDVNPPQKASRRRYAEGRSGF